MADAWKGKNTICWKLRCAHEKCATLLTDPGNLSAIIGVLSDLAEAQHMAKRMDAKLREYKADYWKTFYEDHSVGEKRK